MYIAQLHLDDHDSELRERRTREKGVAGVELSLDYSSPHHAFGQSVLLLSLVEHVPRMLSRVLPEEEALN